MESTSPDAARWQQIKALLQQALEHDPEDRAGFLDGACDDPSLRKTLESLIAYAEVDSFLDRSDRILPAEAFDLDKTTSLEGETLGTYRIGGLIGRGGMGAVYAAVRDDGEFERHVAVKIIRKSVATPETLRRFRAERQLLADIAHPNIALLLDGGTTDDGLPYLVMEHVEGEPIDRYCDARMLPIRTRIELLILLCSAVHFAHERQVIHRDIKPDNVLINRDGAPKLLDFGLAKLLDPDILEQSLEQTAAGRQLMTPAFASPEQVRGDPIGPESDVYSIGVLLYEALTGRRPYVIEKMTPEAVRQAVCQTVPTPPSTAVDRYEERETSGGATISITPDSASALRATDTATLREMLRGDLDAIALRALSKDPEDRFESAAELAQALEACVDRLPKPLAGQIAAPVFPERSSAQSVPTALPTAGSEAVVREPSFPIDEIPERWGELEILDRLGHGQFGTVFKCRDPALDRVMALKLYHPTATGHGVDASDEAVKKILREGQLLARVEHPNVVRVHGVAIHEGVVGLWMEYIEGSTLADLLESHGRMSAREAGNFGLDLCGALAAVHSQGVIHRDVKAQNILREDGGRIILMDFGAGRDLAESVGPDVREIGTPLYSAPEVLAGEPTSFRSDLYSLAVLLFRLVSGQFPVRASSIADLKKKHQEGETTRLRDVRPDLPSGFVRVIEKALAADPADRYATAGEFEQALESSLRAADPLSEREKAAALTPWQRLLTTFLPHNVVTGRFAWAFSIVGAVLFVALAWAGALGLQSLGPEDRPGIRIPMQPPGGLTPSLGFGPAMTLSRDGRLFAYVADDGSTSKLFVQDLSSELQPRPLEATEGARTPFFSPAGDWIGFFDQDDRELKKISISGGAPTPLASIVTFWGAAWGDDGRIVFSADGQLISISEDGGDAIMLDPDQTAEYMYPTLLPGGDQVLVTMRTGGGSFDEAEIAVIPTTGGEPRVVLRNAYYARYAPGDFLVYVQRDEILAVPFDAAGVQATGNPVTLFEDVWTSSWTGYADIAFSDTGNLVFISGGRNSGRAFLVQVDRNGDVTRIVDERGPYRVPRFSPDGTQVFATFADDRLDVWRYDVATGNPRRITDHEAVDAYQVMHPTEDVIAFASWRPVDTSSATTPISRAAIHRKNLQTDEVDVLVASEHDAYPNSWSPDGTLLAYWENHPDTGSDIWIYSTVTGEAVPFLNTTNNELWPAFSPDGNFIAYHANDSGGSGLDVYVRPYPEGTPPVRVSVGGGRVARWGPNGDELFFIDEGRLMAVRVTSEPEFSVGPAEMLFEGAYANAYDAAPDGQSFVMTLEMGEGDPQMAVYFQTDWFVELRSRVNAGQ